MAISDVDFERALRLERDIETARLAWREEQAARARGVTWSGMDPAPARPASAAALRRRAARRAARLRAWMASPDGQIATAMADVQRAARSAHLIAEAVRAALDRRGGEDVRDDLRAMDAQARTLLAAVGMALRAAAP
jgi:hypothetical protein